MRSRSPCVRCACEPNVTQCLGTFDRHRRMLRRSAPWVKTVDLRIVGIHEGGRFKEGGESSSSSSVAADPRAMHRVRSRTCTVVACMHPLPPRIGEHRGIDTTRTRTRYRAVLTCSLRAGMPSTGNHGRRKKFRTRAMTTRLAARFPVDEFHLHRTDAEIDLRRATTVPSLVRSSMELERGTARTSPPTTELERTTPGSPDVHDPEVPSAPRQCSSARQVRPSG